MKTRLSLLVVVLSGIAIYGDWTVDTARASAESNAVDRTAAVAVFRQVFPHPRFYNETDRITSIYGSPFGNGVSPEDTAERFRTEHARVFGVTASDLDPRGPLQDERHTQPLMYDSVTDTYKFTLVYYTQRVAGIPVFRSDLRLLVRNETGFPLVLARNALRDLGGFTPNVAAAHDPATGLATARGAYPTFTKFTNAKLVIWAGIEEENVAPRLAFTFVGDNQMLNTSFAEKRLFVTDAASGGILYEENQILDVDVTGNVSGMATQGIAADTCESSAVEALPYARVNIVSGSTAFADEFGDFVIPNAGSGDVTVQSPLRGDFFRVENAAGGNSMLPLTVTPPGPADFLHNEADTDTLVRAEVNAYLHANIVRDFVLRHSPAYPVIASQLDYTVNVNQVGGICPCNAQYTGNAINFCRESGACPNMAFSVIVHHEYGHHLVAMAGSGQGQYGEGTGDLMGVLITDEPESGIGFFGDCVTPARNAVNNIQFPCNQAIHTCGQLITGSVWDTRAELLITEPDDYQDILANLAVNAILVHSGSSIAPDITIDYLTLDDDDDTIENGTPHYNEINTGFSAHNMPAPPLAILAFVYPEGRPTFSDPNDGAPIVVEIQSVAGILDADQPPLLHASIDGGAFATTPMTTGGEDRFTGTLPSAPCFATIDWYVSAQTTAGDTPTSPGGAPANTFDAFVATDTATVLEEDFESPVGYTVSGDPAGTDTGRWEVGIPAGGGDRGDPPADFDGSGRCYLTGNAPDNTDVDNGTTILTSPAFDMSAANVEYFLSYARWYSNDFGASPNADVFVVEISNDDGANWQELESVGPTGPQVEGGWFHVSHNVAATIEPTAQMRVRFLASDLGAGSVIEAAIDALSIDTVDCEDIDTTPPHILHDGGQNTNPFAGYIDPRAESTDGVNLDQGIDHVAIGFNEVVRAIGGGALTQADFTVSGTGAGHPTVTAVDDSQNPTIALTLSSTIPLKQWTTITAHVEDQAGNVIESAGNQGPGVDEADRVDIGFLPTDVDQNREVTPFDLLRFRQIVNDLFDPTTGTPADFVDINRDGELTPFDLLAYRQLINGIGIATRIWEGESLPERP